MSSTRRLRGPFSPSCRRRASSATGEGARRVEDAPPARRADEGAFLPRKGVPPHQFGRMTYDRATKRVLVVRDAYAAVSHGLTSSPRRGEAAVGRGRVLFDLPQAGR